MAAQLPGRMPAPRLTERRVLVVAVLVWTFIVFYLVHWGATWAIDLRVYRDAAAFLRGHGSPYLGRFTPSQLPFTYPPFALLVLSPLSFGPLGVVKAVWWVLNEAALCGVLYLALLECLGLSRRRALAFAVLGGAVASIALEPVRSNLDYGQINALLMVMIAVDILRIRGRGRGVLVGVAAAIKLTPLLYLAYFLVERDRRAALRGAVTFVAATGLSWAILPTASTKYWVDDAFHPSRTGRPGFVSNQSWNGLLHRVPFHSGTGIAVLWVLASLLTVATAVVAAQRLVARGRRVDALLVLALAELLASPISWSHHWSWLVLAPVVLIERRGTDRPVVVALAVATLIAFAEPYRWPLSGWFGAVLADSLTLAGAALLGVMTWRAIAESRAEEALQPSSG